MNNTLSALPNSVNGADARTSLVRVAVASAVAAMLNLIIYWIGVAAGVSFVVAAPEPINAFTVVLMSAAPLLVMGLLAWLLERWWAVRRVAGWSGLIFALVTIAGSFLAAGDTATALTLSAMHVVVGVAWFVALAPWVKSSASVR